MQALTFLVAIISVAANLWGFRMLDTPDSSLGLAIMTTATISAVVLGTILNPDKRSRKPEIEIIVACTSTKE